MKITFIATVYNEEKTIGRMLESLAKQTRMPDEIVIVDGGSTDGTLSVISNFIKTFTSEESKSLLRHHPRWKTITKKGNRAVGRNEAIRHATGDIIVCSDAGCELDKDWVKNIVEPFGTFTSEESWLHFVQPATIQGGKNLPGEVGDTDVVAGYYAAKPQSVFQKCLVPYVLVMSDRVDPNNFLPATRSMAFTKKIWEKVGGFPEEYSHNEDYVFARKLKHVGAKIVFTKDAVVYWQPRKNLKEAFVMFFRFAYGDAQAGIFRPKVIFLFVRYVIGFSLILSYFIFRSPLILNTLYLILSLYVVWSIVKSYKYVLDWRAIVILPILQVTADMAVILGTIWGIQHKR